MSNADHSVSLNDAAVLGPILWPRLARKTTRAARVLPAGEPVAVLVRYVGNILHQQVAHRLAEPLKRAVKALAECKPEARLGEAGTNAATEAIALLAHELERDGALAVEGPDGDAPHQFLSAVRDPERVVRDLRREMAYFAVTVAAGGIRKKCTYSLILFRETDHGGAVARSFSDNRGAWTAALRPARKDAVDSHLAVILPPHATVGIEALAAELGIAEDLPCVAFLGAVDDPRPDGLLDRIVTRWACTRLQPNGASYPDQLRKVYQTVYQQSAVAPGTKLAAVGDRFVDYLCERISKSLLVRLFLGSVGGRELVEAAGPVLETIE